MRKQRSTRREWRYYLQAPRRRPRLVIVPALIVALAALALALAVPARYRASALMGVHWQDPDAALLSQRGVDVAGRRAELARRRLQDADMAEPLTRMLRANASAGDRSLPPDALEARLLAELHVRPLSADSFVVEFLDRDPARAAQLANGVAEVLAAYGAPLEARVHDAYRQLVEAAVAAGRAAPTAPSVAVGAGVEVPRQAAPSSPAADRAALEAYDLAQRAYQRLLEEWQAAERAGRTAHGPTARYDVARAADVPTRRDSASPLVVGALGALAGIALGLAAALLAEYRDRSVKGPEDLAEILPVPLLAQLPTARERDGAD